MENNSKTLLIASFIPTTTIDWFLKYLNEKFKIKKENVFIYEIDNSDIEYLLTFKIKCDKKIDLKFYFSNATIVNIKNGCIFSINGLNRFIESDMNIVQGNANYKTHLIDWKKYKDKLILSNKDKLTIKSIKKIDSICKKNKN